jgi:uncharacterized protein (TIRG00374 family)
MKRMREMFWLLIRLGLAVGVMIWLLKKMGLDQMGQTLHNTAGHWPWVAAAFVITLPPQLMSMFRWKLILDAQGMRLAWSRITSIFFISLFFNAFMIGPTGGDLVKAYYTARETHHKKTEAVMTIFIDRVIGLLILAMLVGVTILIRWDFFMVDHPEIRSWALTALVVCGAITGGGVLAFSIHLFEAFPFLRRWNRYPAVGRVFELVEKAYNAFYICRTQPRLLLKITAHSLALQFLLVAAVSLIGRALELDLPFLAYLTFSPLIGLISAIPVTPGGLGIREGASIHLWSVLGVPSEKAFLLGFVPYVLLVLWGLPGGLLFLFHRAGTGHSLKEELADSADGE